LDSRKKLMCGKQEWHWSELAEVRNTRIYVAEALNLLPKCVSYSVLIYLFKECPHTQRNTSCIFLEFHDPCHPRAQNCDGEGCVMGLSTRATALPEGTQRPEFEISYVYWTALECRVLYSI
jgi:hypothetical protein